MAFFLFVAGPFIETATVPWKPKKDTRFLEWILRRKIFNPHKGIVIFSEPRGGSTWLFEMLSKIPGVISNWEPFHQELGVIPKEWHYGERPFIDEKSDHSRLKSLLDQIFRLRAFSIWTLRFSNQNVFTRRILTKFVNANTILPWILENFSFKNKPILLVRHPIATARSQLKAFGEENDVIMTGLEKKSSGASLYSRHQEFYLSLQNPLEKKVAALLIHNIDVFNSSVVRERCMTVYYEHLVTDPHNQMSRVILNFGYKNPKKLLKKMKFRRRSKTDFKRDFIKNPEEQLEKMFDDLSSNQLTRIQEIFDHFSFDLYAANNYQPKTENGY